MDGMTDVVVCSADIYPCTYPTSSRWVLRPDIPSFCFMDKGTGQSCALLLPLWADGGILLAPVPLPALFILRQPLLTAPCGQLRILSPDHSFLSSSQAYRAMSVSFCSPL